MKDLKLLKQEAQTILRAWKGENYKFGNGIIDRIGEFGPLFGKQTMVVCNNGHSEAISTKVMESLVRAGVEISGEKTVRGARPNTPREDVYRIETAILQYKPDSVVAIGGGSTIDACKAAIALATYGKDVSVELDAYFGTGLVTAAMQNTGKKMIPLIAVETASSSGAHLTKYANVTDPVSGQKLLIVDPAVTPAGALFDYSLAASMPHAAAVAGILDGIAHTFESFCGANPDTYDHLKELTLLCLELTLKCAPVLMNEPNNMEALEGIGLATDLGGYAIMIGGTSGAHLTSFSLVNVAAHGTACGIMNPYYAVFYAPKIKRQLISVGSVLQEYGYITEDFSESMDRKGAEAVARGLMAFSKAIGAPVVLSQLPGFSERYIQQILSAAKDPELAMKLKNMPVSMTAADVDMYMEPVIRAAVSGRLEDIINMPDRV